MGLLQKVAEVFRPKKSIRLTRSIILTAERNGEEGEVLELPWDLANALISDGSAVACDASKAEGATPQPRVVDRMARASHLDPASRPEGWQVRPQQSEFDS